MRGRILLCLCICTLFIPQILIAGAVEKSSVINWEKDAEGAFSKAKTAEKPILVDFFSPT